MFKHFVSLALLYLLLVLETARWEGVIAPAWQPEFLWAGLVLIAWRFRGPMGVVWSAGIGLVFDSVAQQPMGVGVISGTLVGYLLQVTTPHSFRPGMLTATFYSFGSIVLVLLLNSGITQVVLHGNLPRSIPLSDAWLSAGITACAVGLIWMLFQGLKRCLPLSRSLDGASYRSHSPMVSG